jgi:hypothetical protein
LNGDFSYQHFDLRIKKMNKFKIGRDAGNGQFIPVKEAQERKNTATVETIKIPTPTKTDPKKSTGK